MNAELGGRVVLVTGATGGIGTAVSEALAARGASLLITGRSEEALDALSRSLTQRFAVKVATVAADLSRTEAPGRIVEALRREFAALDVLINNAGVVEAAPLEKTTVAQWDLIMAVNARAPFLLTTAALGLLRESDDAVVVNIGSVVSHKGYTGQGAYVASKHALLGLTKVLARELQADGIRVHIVSPGGVATAMIGRVRPDLDQSELIQPHEVAAAVLFLVQYGGNAVIDEIALRRRSGEPWK